MKDSENKSCEKDGPAYIMRSMSVSYVNHQITQRIVEQHLCAKYTWFVNDAVFGELQKLPDVFRVGSRSSGV